RSGVAHPPQGIASRHRGRRLSEAAAGAWLLKHVAAKRARFEALSLERDTDAGGSRLRARPSPLVERSIATAHRSSSVDPRRVFVHFVDRVAINGKDLHANPSFELQIAVAKRSDPCRHLAICARVRILRD